jgi:hypothetical protein
MLTHAMVTVSPKIMYHIMVSLAVSLRFVFRTETVESPADRQLR